MPCPRRCRTATAEARREQSSGRRPSPIRATCRSSRKAGISIEQYFPSKRARQRENRMRALAATSLLLASSPLAAAEIEGRWRSPGGNSIIEIAPCDSEWCGTVAWASNRAKKDAAKATEQLIGTQL